jgi:hypothetical protein
MKDIKWKCNQQYTIHARQDDEVSCGAYACYFLEMLVNGNLSFSDNDVDISAYRTRIADTF